MTIITPRSMEFCRRRRYFSVLEAGAGRVGTTPTEKNMPKTYSTFAIIALTGSVLVLGGCSNKGEIDALRSEIASVRAIAEGADAKATAAQSEAAAASAAAAQAADDAKVASEKADRIFRANLRK